MDSTHAQWRTFISLTLVFILPMVGFSHSESVLPHAEVCSSSRWPVDLRAEVRLFPLTRRLESSCKDRVCFSRVFCCWVQAFPHAQTVEVNFPCESHAHCLCFGAVVFPMFSVGCGVQLRLGRYAFVLSHFLQWSASESSCCLGLCITSIVGIVGCGYCFLFTMGCELLPLFNG